MQIDGAQLASCELHEQWAIHRPEHAGDLQRPKSIDTEPRELGSVEPKNEIRRARPGVQDPLVGAQIAGCPLIAGLHLDAAAASAKSIGDRSGQVAELRPHEEHSKRLASGPSLPQANIGACELVLGLRLDLFSECREPLCERLILDLIWLCPGDERHWQEGYLRMSLEEGLYDDVWAAEKQHSELRVQHRSPIRELEGQPEEIRRQRLLQRATSR